MDIYEFVTKMAEQHKSLLKVIDLQNNSIQALNNRMNAMAASQLVVFALLTEMDKVNKEKVADHLRAMLANPHIANSQHLVAQLQELLEICESSPITPNAEPKISAWPPAWFRGIVQGGRGKKD